MLIKPSLWRDDRGFFTELFQTDRYAGIAGIHHRFVQENFSVSRYGVLRGLHLQVKFPQGKLVTCLYGKVFDVAVDVRLTSPTFGRYHGVTLDSEEMVQFWIPPGFAHGFCVLSDEARVYYRCTDFYHPEDESGLKWNDPDLNIPWPVSQPTISPKDANLPCLRDLRL